MDGLRSAIPMSYIPDVEERLAGEHHEDHSSFPLSGMAACKWSGFNARREGGRFSV
jgi:hypothetical protein